MVTKEEEERNHRLYLEAEQEAIKRENKRLDEIWNKFKIQKIGGN